MKKEEENKRRKFIKKLAYSAPIFTVLGQLAKPTKVKAGGSQIPTNPGDSDTGFPPGF